jgi:hypothetical protein
MLEKWYFIVFLAEYRAVAIAYHNLQGQARAEYL